jgi:hypothetical protein
VVDIRLIETVTYLRGCCRPVPLDQLVQLLMGSALEAATDRKVKFTDEERQRLHTHSNILSGAVAELVKILVNHPLEHVRENRLAELSEALGSAVLIASCVIDNPTLRRLRTAATNATRSAEKKETKRIIADELAKLERPYLTDEAKARHIKKKVCARAGKDLETDTITKYMREIRVEESSD